MKANQKSLSTDEAVSPVIAVILMVAITVVLAATVYVWVSGFGTQSGNAQKSMALTSAGTLTGAAGSAVKTYAVASASNTVKWSDVTITVNGVTKTIDPSPTCSGTFAVSATSHYGACHGGAAAGASGVITAGDTVTLGGLTSGDTLRVLDAQANSVILTLTVG